VLSERLQPIVSLFLSFKLSSPTIVSAGSSPRNVFLKNQLYVRLEEEMLLCFYHRLRRRPI
jgi:hypothetical protein